MVSSERGKKKRKFYFSVCDELGTKKKLLFAKVELNLGISCPDAHH